MLYSELSDPLNPPVIASDVDYIRSSGDTIPGIGAAYFSTTTTGSPYARTFTAADSRVFEMLPEQDGWSLAAFGMLPNAETDTAQSAINRAAHQQAVDNAIWLSMAGKGTHRLMFTPGIYHIDEAIRVFKHQSDDSFWFVSIEISAPARGYVGNERTVIRNTNDDQPCYAVQSARSVKFSNFSIQGANANANPSYAQLVGDPSTWANLAGMRDTTWSPACAIVVDPFGSTIEGGDAYPGLEEFYTYNLRGSSATIIENMECKGFPVGILLSPSTNTQNNDSVMIRDCDISYNKTGLAVCQSQNRAVRLENCRMHAAHIMIDTETYGNGNGAFPLANNLNVTFCKYLINASGGVSRAKLSNSDVESTYSIGAWRGAFPLDIEGCQMKLIPPNALTAPQQPAIDYHLHATAPVNFIGGYVGFYSNVGVPLGIAGGGRINFKGCAIDTPPMLRDPELVTYEGVSLRYLNGGARYGADRQFVASTDTLLSVQVDAKMPVDGTAAFHALGYTRFRNVASPIIDLAPPVTITATGDGLATFTPPTPGKFNVGEWLSSWDPFDGLMPDETTPVELRFVPIGKVRSIVGSTVTLEAVPIGFTTGTYTPYVQYLPSFRPRCYGTATLGSNVLTGVTPTYHGFQPGDRLLASEGVPYGAYVTAVDNGAGTITISLNATASGVSRIRTGDLTLDDAPRSAAPGSGTVTYVGDYFRNTGASVDGNDMVLRGWIATSIVNPGTLEPQYVSTVSPAT
jgi:hypothetical protein